MNFFFSLIIIFSPLFVRLNFSLVDERFTFVKGGKLMLFALKIFLPVKSQSGKPKNLFELANLT